MEKKYKIFELGEPKKGNDQWTDIEVIGLDQLYADVGKHAHPCDGAVGLLYSHEYPGCCQMYYTWRSQPEEDGELRIEFYPAHTKDGDYVLIKTPNETPLMFYNSRITGFNKETLESTRVGILTYKTNGWN